MNSLCYTNVYSNADTGVCGSSVVPLSSKGHCFARKSPEESVETGSRPKEERNGRRGTLFHVKVVTIKESKTVFFSDRVL